MNECCHKTFINTLNEVILLIDQKKIHSTDQLKPVIKMCINLLEKSGVHNEKTD